MVNVENFILYREIILLITINKTLQVMDQKHITCVTKFKEDSQLKELYQCLNDNLGSS